MRGGGLGRLCGRYGIDAIPADDQAALATDDRRRALLLRGRAAGRPQKGPTCAVRSPTSVGSMFQRMSTGRRDGSLSGARAWWAAVAARSFFPINSRLGRCEFPVRSATGNSPQGIDLPHGFCGQTAVLRAKSKNFPFKREKPGNSPTGRNKVKRPHPHAKMTGCVNHRRRSLAPGRGRQRGAI